jgi:GTP pyrophosphokinase
MEYSSRVVDAFAFAYELHCKQVRKGSLVPYITHLMGVAAIVGRYGGDEDQFIGALLHDAVEDQGGIATLDRIRERFGDVVAEYVLGCSDSCESPKLPWRERKERFIAFTATASPKQKLIIAADKLHNTRAVVNDLYDQGDKVWDLFKTGREGNLWYHMEVVRALAKNWSHPLLRELTEEVEKLHRLAANAEIR